MLNTKQVSGYPSDGQAANVSKETTVRELLEVEGFEKDDFRTQNINLLFGVVNDVEYCTTMFNFPELKDLPILLHETKEKKNIEVLDIVAA